MLVRGRVQHDVRLVARKDLVKRRRVADRDDLHLHVQRHAVGDAQLLLNVVRAVLVLVQNHELFGLHLGDLAAQLAADRAAAARDEHRLPAVIRGGALIGELHRLAEEQLLNVKLAQAALSVFYRLRQRIVVHLELAARLLVLVVELLFALRPHLGQREHDLLHRKAHQALLRRLALREDGNAVDRAADLLLIHIDKAAWPVRGARVVGQLLREHHAHAARADDGNVDLWGDAVHAVVPSHRLVAQIREA